MAVTCTPSELIGHNPCLNCLSDKELLAILMYIFAYANGHTVTQALTDSACFNCLGQKHQKLVALVTILADHFLRGASVPTIVNDIKCLECAPDSQITAALLSEICTYYGTAQD
jgi:hypothetical protein